MHAIASRKTELVQIFLNRHSLINGAEYAWGWTPMHWAASK